MDINKTLPQFRKDIKEEILNILNNEKTSGRLTDVKSIIYGDRTDIAQLKTPSVWILPAPHIPQVMSANMVEHNFTFDFIALTRDNDPDKAIELVEDIASRVYDIIAETKNLNGIVFEVNPTRVDPSYRGNPSIQLYWCSVQFAFVIQRYE